VSICKSKFSDTLVIKKEDEDAIKLTALLHDLGHGVYSHVSEKHLEGSHENRTIEIISDTKTEVNKTIRENFSKEVLNKIIYLINLKDNIKIENNNEEMDLLFKNLSNRVAEMIKEEIEIMGPVRVKDVEAAQDTIVMKIRDLEKTGEIVINRGGEDEVFV